MTEEQRRETVTRLQGLGAHIAELLGADETFRLMLASSLTIAQAAYKPDEIADMLLQLSENIRAGGLDQPFIQ
jgi:hypothetical protein